MQNWQCSRIGYHMICNEGFMERKSKYGDRYVFVCARGKYNAKRM